MVPITRWGLDPGFGVQGFEFTVAGFPLPHTGCGIQDFALRFSGIHSASGLGFVSQDYWFHGVPSSYGTSFRGSYSRSLLSGGSEFRLVLSLDGVPVASAICRDPFWGYVRVYGEQLSIHQPQIRLLEIPVSFKVGAASVTQTSTTNTSQPLKCRPVFNNLLPFKGLNMGIPVIIPTKGRGFINQGSTLQLFSPLLWLGKYSSLTQPQLKLS